MARASLPVLTASRRALPTPAPPRPREFTGSSALVDGRGRRYEYARISVTDRCDMACVYCMPGGGETEHGTRIELLDDAELGRLVAILARSGVRRIRLTGGEPLVRPRVPELVAALRAAGATEVVLTTNGSLLARHAAALARAGLAGVNVSIDSLDPERFAAITRGGVLRDVLEGLEAALAEGLRVKTNTVALGGVNDDELLALTSWAWARGATPRFIELMPIGEGAGLPHERFVSAAAMRARLSTLLEDARGEHDPGAGPARYVRSADGRSRVGFITAVSDEFCGTCNRVRITSHGELRGCLADRAAVSLRDVMRSGASDDDVAWSIAWALGGKAAGHHFAAPDEREHERVGMSLVGG